MRLIIPRGASPKRYSELIISGHVKPEYVKTEEELLTELKKRLPKKQRRSSIK